MQNFVAPKLETLRVFSLFKYISFDSTISIGSVWLIKVHHVESQIVWFKMHQRGSVKKGNMGMHIGKSFFKSMRVLWAILGPLKMAHITLINLKREIVVLILASSVNMGHY